MHAPQSPPRRPLPSSTGRRRSRRLAPLMEPIEGRLLLSAAPVAGLDSLLPLVRQGRLSVVPLTAAQWKAIESRGRG